MKSKRFLPLLLSILMMLGLTTANLAEVENTITAYFNVTQYGKILDDKDGNALALAPVELSGKESYTLDDAFKKLHDVYYEGGSDAGYASASGGYGLYITKLMGDASGNLGYQINGASEYVEGLSYEVENGDYIDVAIYKNEYPDTESYARFNKYESAAYVGIPVELTAERAGYDENWQMVFSACSDAIITINGVDTEYKTDENGKINLTFESEGKYVISARKTKTLNEAEVPDITAPVCVVNVKAIPDTSISVPSDAEFFVGAKPKAKHFVDFIKIDPTCSVADGENTKYYFELDGIATDSSLYNYRISGENYITYSGTFKKSTSVSVTKEQLMPEGKSKTTVDRNKTSNNGYNVADIYLNINPQGYLKLKSGDTYQIVSLRNWEIVNTTTGNYLLEPDYHFEVIDENGNVSNVAEIDEKGLLTAKTSGMAIVLVTYDSMIVNYGTNDDFYGAVYPENTGVFVVSVDAGEAEESKNKQNEDKTSITINEGKNNAEVKLSGDVLDSEHDCIYYIGEKGEYTFTPKTAGAEVYAANPEVGTKMTYHGFEKVEANGDGSVSVPLTTGRNIIKVEKDGNAEYHVITAKKVDVIINKGEAVQPGDAVSIVFDKLYAPANKLASVYNMSAQVLYTEISAYDGQIAGGSKKQYNFANSEEAQTVSALVEKHESKYQLNYDKIADLTVPADYEYDTFNLSGGLIFECGYGDSYGNHRGITYETGKAPNLNADMKVGYLAKLPDIKIPITLTSAELSSIEINKETAKTAYYAGDKFDTSSIVVTAKYADETTQKVLNYTVSPEILTPDTEEVTILYKGFEEKIPVTVTNPKVTAIEITNPPSRTKYTEGDLFSPSGMTVYAVYENGAKKETTDYTYSPNRELETADTEIQVSYNGENAVEGIEAVVQKIEVTAKTSGSGSSSSADKISVYFTLLGDSKHGTPTGKSNTHTKKDGNLETWIAKSKITLDKNSKVIDLVKKALSLNGIPYTNEGNYISKIKNLSEFSNGELSGWMYMLNGKYALKGVDEQVLSDGDAVIFHYTDDYTVENTGFVSTSGGSSSGSSKPKNDTKEENVKTETKDSDEAIEKSEFKENTYKDVKTSDWYYEAVKYVHENNLMNGTEQGFEPESNMTRAMFVTVLWRMAKEPVVDYELKFKDVPEGAWYTEAVRWAASEKIISGISEDMFGTDEPSTREQIATILYRYMQKKQSDKVGEGNSVSSFADSNLISDYAVTAVGWAVDCGIINGKTETEICPQDDALRAEVASMIMRLYK